MKVIRVVLLVLTVTTLNSGARAGLMEQAWVQTYDGGVGGDDRAVAMTRDSDGNVLVTGSSKNTSRDYDIVTIKYSAAGVPLWTNRYDGGVNGDDRPVALAMDSGGNALVLGKSLNNGYQFVTIKYSSKGSPVWTNYFPGTGNGQGDPRGLAVDNADDVYVAGSADYAKYVTIKYSNVGGPVWTNFFHGPGQGSDTVAGLALDGSGNIFVTGTSYNTNALKDYATLKYSSQGQALWTNRYSHPEIFVGGDCEAYAMALDSVGNVFVTGTRALGDSGPAWYATVKYSNSGESLWEALVPIPFPPPFSSALLLTANSSGDLFFSAYSSTIIKYSSNGLPIWTNLITSSIDSGAGMSAMTPTSGGGLLLTGSHVADFSQVPYNSSVMTSELSNDGMVLWTNLYGGTTVSILGPPPDGGQAVATDDQGNVFVAGAASYPEGNGNFVTIQYSVAHPTLTMNRIDNAVVLSWNNDAFGLQSAPDIGGVFTNVPAATSPYTNSLDGSRKFFRLQSY